MRELEASREIIRLKTLEEQKKSEQELALAQETQESLLPRSLPQFESFHIHAFNQPTRYVGGDFYDFHAAEFGGVDGCCGGCLWKRNVRLRYSVPWYWALSIWNFAPGRNRKRS